MNSKGAIVIYIIFVYFILREYIPFIAYNTPTAVNVLILSLAYIILLIKLKFENIKKYFHVGTYHRFRLARYGSDDWRF